MYSNTKTITLHMDLVQSDTVARRVLATYRPAYTGEEAGAVDYIVQPGTKVPTIIPKSMFFAICSAPNSPLKVVVTNKDGTGFTLPMDRCVLLTGGFSDMLTLELENSSADAVQVRVTFI